MNNMNQCANERTINISEIIWRLLEQWKAVACFALIIALLFMGFMQQRYSNQVKDAINQQEKNEQKTSEDIINELSEDEQDAVNNAFNMRQQLVFIEEYLRESPVMKEDPYHSRRFKMDWAISGDSGMEAILAESYMLYLKSDDFCQQLVPFFGEKADVDQVREAIFSNAIGTEVQGAFSCEVLLYQGVDEAGVQRAFSIAMESARNTITDEIAEHKLQCINEEIVVGMNLALEQYQKKVYDRLASIKSQLKTRTDELSLTQKQVYERLINDGKEKTDIIISENRHISLRNLFIGLILGVLLYAGCMFLYLLVSGKVISRKDLGGYGLYTLAQWYQVQSPKGLAVLFTDRVIHHSHHKNCFDKDLGIRQTVKAICDVSKPGEKQLLFAATAPFSSEQASFCNGVKEALSQDGIFVNIISLDDYHSLFDECSASDIDGVILVVIDGKTKHKTIEKTLNQCVYYNVSTYGSIYFG